MTNLLMVERVEGCPPRKTLVNMDNHNQVKLIMKPRIEKPTSTKVGFAARILVANSRIEMAFCMTNLPRMTDKIHRVAMTAGTSELHRITAS